MLSIFEGQKSVQTRLVRTQNGACLVVSFRTSQPQAVWQFDLEKNPNFTMALRNEEQEWNLGVTSPEGVFSPAAHFITRGEAEEAFEAVHKVLMRQGIHRIGGWGRFILVLAGLVFGFLLAGMWILKTGPGRESSGASVMDLPESDKSETPKRGEITSGIPLPADEVLKAPPPN